ncbi:hypothetical protein FACS189485_16110 [Spirochaetia bacterium]|nr:hypothetical protein FACS189485_16110 [Spirochaetia bacterium]
MDYIKTPLWKKMLKGINLYKFKNYLLWQKRNRYNEKNKTDRHFDLFREKYLVFSDKVYYSFQELVDNPPVADAYIAGSDQIWNFSYASLYNVRNLIQAYFLNFGNNQIRRIAYAASFGTPSIKEEYIEEINRLLLKFEYVSVREKSGVSICKKCGITSAEWMPDPTMLLLPDDYRRIYKNATKLKQEKKYCLLYLLGNTCQFSISNLYIWAAERDLEVVYISGNSQYDNYKKIYATVSDWLYLIDNAEYVVSNSFHATVFALLFQKNFCVIPLVKEMHGMNERLVSLFDIFEISPRFMTNNYCDLFDTPINWDFVSKKFEKIHSENNLLKVLNNRKDEN